MTMPRRSWVTNHTSEVFARAHALAESLGQGEVTPVHLTISIIEEGENPGVHLLDGSGVRRDSVLRDLKAMLPARGNPLPEQRLDWTAADERILALAAAEACELGHEWRGCEHLLLAFLRDPASGPGAVLVRHGVDYARLKEASVRRIEDAEERAAASHGGGDVAPLK